MRKFIQLFNKVGGKEILFQYRQAHVLTFAFLQIMCQGFSKKSLEIVRLSINNKILKKLRRKYHAFIVNYKVNALDITSLERKHSNKVWVCWLQGIEKAPEVVQVCYHSLKTNLVDREILLITEENYRQYICFPDYIQDKIDNGKITKTHMSDLLRLELLNNYGGTWIDATVFCSSKVIPEYMLNSDLFVFQTLKPGLDGQPVAMSSWFMTACTNHPILLLTQALLYEYWSNHDVLIDYFLLHNFFQLSIESYPEEWNKVVPFCNSTPHIILLRMFESYNEDIWNYIKEQTPFHKLTYKFTEEQRRGVRTYYDVLFTNRKDMNIEWEV